MDKHVQTFYCDSSLYYCHLNFHRRYEKTQVLTLWGLEKITPVYRQHFQVNFIEWNRIVTRISPQFVLRGPINDYRTLDQMMAWASYQIRKIAGCACAGNAGNVFPRRRFQRKPLVSDPGMHHGTCVTHVPWCMSGSLTCGDGENVPGIPGACAPAILRIWQEAHGIEQATCHYLNQWWTSLLTHSWVTW